MATKLTKRQTRVLHHLNDRKQDVSITAIATALHLSEQEVRAEIAVLQEHGFVSGPPSLLARVTSMLMDLGENIDQTAEDFPSSIVLLASYLTGASETDLAESLNYDAEFVGVVGARLRNAGIWQGDFLAPAVISRWQAEKDGDIAFWMDCGVASGAMICKDGDTDSPGYSLSESGRQIVERRLSGRS